MATTVIIPARNEAKTIGTIVKTFNQFPETKGNVYAAIDADTDDGTSGEVWSNGGCAFYTGERGKGQVVAAAVSLLTRQATISDRIILCDGDYTGLRQFHIYRILNRYTTGMVIGIPDWPDIPVPSHVTNSWPRVSGFRCLPWKLIPENTHGYLLETQLNIAAIDNNERVRFVTMHGLKSPFQWPLTPKRMEELLRDQKWGKEHGVL